MEELERKLTPPQTKGHISVAKLSEWWYVACESKELSPGPLQRTILGTPLVLFRDRSGQASALLDRCPHRNVPLSLGRVSREGDLECAYHGWCFDGGGGCTKVPGLLGDPDSRGRSVTSYPVREQDGFVWVWGDPEVEPHRDPFALPTLGAGYTTVIRSIDMEGSVWAAAENALDVPHTAYLHAGLFRGTGKPHRVTAQVRRWEDRAEVEYIGEPRPEGVIGRLLSPSGGLVQHWDRFFLPSVTQVEYRLGEENHVVVSTAMTPISDFLTRMYAAIQLRVRVPGWVLKPALDPLAMRVLRQDADILRKQTETIQRFGGEQFVSTDLDLLGPHIWRLLRQAERGNLEQVAEPFQKEIEMEV